MKIQATIIDPTAPIMLHQNIEFSAKPYENIAKKARLRWIAKYGGHELSKVNTIHILEASLPEINIYLVFKIIWHILTKHRG